MDKNDLISKNSDKIMRLPGESDIGITSAVYKAFGCLGDDVDGDLISRSALLKETIRAEGDLHMPNGRVMHVECIPVAFIVEASAVDPVHAAGACYCWECRSYNKPRLGYCSIHMDKENPDDFCGYGKRKE